jgi:fermentation-respiration switch protein FrsA (DUF1100 family)
MLDRLIRRLVFPRFAVPDAPPAAAAIAGLERLERRIPGGTVEAWLLRGDGAGAARPGPAVIFAHGNAELIDHWPGLLSWYPRHGVTLLLPEYRGYGRSAGRPSQDGIVEDFLYFHDALVQRPEVDPRRIVFHGRSLGGGVVCALARERPARAMILQSTFTSLRRLVRRFLVPGSVVGDPFDNLAAIRGLEGPLLVFHGEEDRLVPFAHGKELVAAARRGRLVAYPGVDHRGCPPDWVAFFAEVEAFLRQAGVL